MVKDISIQCHQNRLKTVKKSSGTTIRMTETFMKTWSAFSSSDPDTRSFGYAYSELIIAKTM